MSRLGSHRETDAYMHLQTKDTDLIPSADKTMGPFSLTNLLLHVTIRTAVPFVIADRFRPPGAHLETKGLAIIGCAVMTLSDQIPLDPAELNRRGIDGIIGWAHNLQVLADLRIAALMEEHRSDIPLETWNRMTPAELADFWLAVEYTRARANLSGQRESCPEYVLAAGIVNTTLFLGRNVGVNDQAEKTRLLGRESNSSPLSDPEWWRLAIKQAADTAPRFLAS